VSDDRGTTGDLAAAEAKRKAKAYVGQVVSGRYRVDAIVAMGGMGAVFRAEHVHMRKQVALKLLHPSTQNLPELVTRFERESIVGGHVSHPNVCQATDFGKLEDGSHYLVLEYVEGKTLHEILKQGRLEPERAAEIAVQIAAGLGAAHQLGIVHRDVKPANVMICDGPSGMVKIVDFGLAKLPAQRFHIDEKISVTTAGTVFGTVAYMAPELAKGMVAVDHRSDLYALGVILYEMLGGKHPFDAIEPSALFKQHLKQPPPPIAQRAPGADVPPELEAVVQKLLAKDPADRYQSTDELIEAICEAVPSVEPPLSSINDSARMRLQPDASDPGDDVAPTSDASPPPAPPADSVQARPSAVRRALRAAALGVVVLGGAGAAWKLGVLGIESGPSFLPTVITHAPATATASASASASAAATASATATQPAGPPSSLTSPEVIRLRTVMNEAAAARDAKRGAAAVMALAKAAPEAFRDRDVIAEAAAVAVSVALDPALAGDVFGLLGGPTLGEGGPDVLFHVASFYGGSKGAARAQELLATPEVLARASPALRVTRDLKNLPCKDRPSLFDRAVAEGDERTLAMFSASLSPSCVDSSGACCAQADPRLVTATARLRQRLHK
jgi:serine/threonine-protein kinase